MEKGKDKARGLIQDICASKKEADQTHSELGYIFSSIRHEIGNPINAIKITISVLKRNIGKFSDEKILEYTDRVLLQINRLEYLLNSFKNFNMFENMDIVSVRVGEFLMNFLSLLEDDFKEKGIHVSLHLHEGDDTARADPLALHQVMLNIIRNAVDALKEKKGKHIDIHTSKKDGDTQIQIKDNGQGFTDYQLKHVFKPFFTGKEDGTGLGLVIVKNILNRMNAEIKIESTENVGTSVTISIPGGDHEHS
ncbi:MAG: sensor histidine kinase [Candidatus Omnitrophota bacterium]